MFVQENENGLIYMRSDILPFRHLFSTRFGGVSEGEFASLNILGGKGDRPENVRENFTRIAAVLGAGPDDCAVTKQVHGNTVRIVGESDRHVCLSTVPYEADGIVTATPGMPLFCAAADCIPVLLCDPDNAVVAAVHCGWRSSAGDILKNALEAMCSLGAAPSSSDAVTARRLLTCGGQTQDG